MTPPHSADAPPPDPSGHPGHSAHAEVPRRLDLQKDQGLTVEWADGGTSFFPIAYLRRMSPSADQRELRKQMESNPLTVLPSARGGGRGAGGPLVAETAELVGTYAIRIRFSDGHASGIYSWAYLRDLHRELEASNAAKQRGEG